MPLPTPPSLQTPAPLPSHVHATFKEAVKAVPERLEPKSHSVLAYLAGTPAQADAARAWAATLEGAKLRGWHEIWIASPGDPEAQELLSKFQIRSLPALLSLARQKREFQLLHARLGPEAEDPAKAFARIDDLSPLEVQSEADRLCKAFPELGDAAHLAAFQAARSESLQAGGAEPYRTWLLKLMKEARNPFVQAWAASRLLEADAALGPGDPPPLKVYGAYAYDHMFAMLQPIGKTGADIRANKETLSWFADFGDVGDIPDDAPFWSDFRKGLQADPNLRLTLPLYAILAPHLKAEDRSWLLRQAGLAASDKTFNPMAPALWACLDWLIVYGEPKDWDDFKAVSQRSEWQDALDAVEAPLRNLPTYWGVPQRLDSLFCDGLTEDEFWKHPEACLAEWGVTQDTLARVGWNDPKIKHQPALIRYPVEAKRLQLVNLIRMHLIVDVKGKVRSVRPDPGYALYLFAPEAMRWLSEVTFEPPTLAGVPRPGIFRYNLNFRLTAGGHP